MPIGIRPFALGILGDASLVPELVPLTYHYNMNTRLEAQVALVRLTGENFGRDVAAWKAWWEKQGGTPPVSDKTVAWATSPWMQSMLQKEGVDTPEKQDQMDRRFARSGMARMERPSAQPAAADLAGPSVVQTVPKTATRDVDPTLTEIRVTFNKEMADGSWSWCRADNLPYPTTTGKPHYDADKKHAFCP